jgi:hypothetical protein
MMGRRGRRGERNSKNGIYIGPRKTQTRDGLVNIWQAKDEIGIEGRPTTRIAMREHTMVRTILHFAKMS